jgi:hypothetical protein
VIERLRSGGECSDECPPLSLTKEWCSPSLVFTHGNPEHRFAVDSFAVISDDEWERRVIEWLCRLHAYERGDSAWRLAAPDPCAGDGG